LSTSEMYRFRTVALLTVALVYLLILVGGAVRATGSGMGCPDWPKCFGGWIPPTHESQLPPDYQQIYADRGYAETRFNARKTWIEYLNRLLGVTIGLFILATMIASRKYLRRDPVVTAVAVVAFLAVCFQGWLGSRVVASNLEPGMITLHMLMAQFIVGTLIFTAVRSQKPLLDSHDYRALHPAFKPVLIVAMLMTLLQVTMGTQVRESVDIIALALNHTDRADWIEHLPPIFLVHRSFSSIILFTNLWLVWQVLSKLPSGLVLRKLAIGLVGLLVATILLGVVMDRLHMPAVAQPVHMWGASLIFGVQFAFYNVYRCGISGEAGGISTPAGNTHSAIT